MAVERGSSYGTEVADFIDSRDQDAQVAVQLSLNPSSAVLVCVCLVIAGGVCVIGAPDW